MLKDLFIGKDCAYTFMYNGKNRVAIVLEVQDKQALCWELTENNFRRYNIKNIISPTDVTINKVLRFANDYFAVSGKTSDEIVEYYSERDCIVFFGERFTFVVNKAYLVNQRYGNKVNSRSKDNDYDYMTEPRCQNLDSLK